MRNIVNEKIITAIKQKYPDLQEREILEAIAYDDVFSLLKAGAKALWNNRSTLLPTLTPIINQGISWAKDAIRMYHMGKQMPAKIKEAVMSDHHGLTDRIKDFAHNQMYSQNTQPNVTGQQTASLLPQQTQIPSEILPVKNIGPVDYESVKTSCFPHIQPTSTVKRLAYGG